MRAISYIVIHGTYTYPAQDIGAAEITDWHVNENGWADIGYHFVIKRTGCVERGRDVADPGAHVRGQNANSIGIALVGGRSSSDRWEFNYTQQQMAALDALVEELREAYPKAEVVGHGDLDKRECPGFNVKGWASNG